MSLESELISQLAENGDICDERYISDRLIELERMGFKINENEFYSQIRRELRRQELLNTYNSQDNSKKAVRERRRTMKEMQKISSEEIKKRIEEEIDMQIERLKQTDESIVNIEEGKLRRYSSIDMKITYSGTEVPIGYYREVKITRIEKKEIGRIVDLRRETQCRTIGGKVRLSHPYLVF